MSVKCFLWLCEDGRAYAAYVHEALYDSNDEQKESLLSVHQSLLDTRNGIDDRARCERDVNGAPGRQIARFGQVVMPFFFDGFKCFFEVHPITESELGALPSVTLTDGSVPYEPMARLHSRRRHVDTPSPTVDWKRCLGFPPDHVVAKTLNATTQLAPSVEAETREIMRDHFQTRLPELKVRRVNDVCYVDTFFSSITSVRGFTCWNLFCFKRTGLDVAYLMRRRAQSPPTLARMITDCGAPRQIKSDNAPEFKGQRWIACLEQHSISSVYTEAHHPNQNLAERRGGTLKAAVVHLLRISGVPLHFWCYALEYMCLFRSVTARRSLEWMLPHKRHWGDRPDISVFRFVFYEPIWYYNPRQAFPKPKMLKGRFMGIAQNVGDAFCYLILTQPENDSDGETPQVLARSVIRRRYVREESPVIAIDDNSNSITFYRSDGVTPLDTPNDVSEETEPIEDVVLPPEEIRELQTDLRSVLQDGVDPTDEFENEIFEVYGPPTKRQRISSPCPSGLVLPTPSVLATQRSTSTSEDHSVLPTQHATLPSQQMMCNDESTKLGLVTPGLETDFDSSPSIAAATTAGLSNDDCRDGSLKSPSNWGAWCTPDNPGRGSTARDPRRSKSSATESC
jgi:hypothetical protein